MKSLLHSAESITVVFVAKYFVLSVAMSKFLVKFLAVLVNHLQLPPIRNYYFNVFFNLGDLRVCTYCCKVVLSYLQSSDVGADLSADLKVLQESLMNKYGVANVSPSAYSKTLSPSMSTSDSLDVASTLKRKISVGYQEEKFASGRYLILHHHCVFVNLFIL